MKIRWSYAANHGGFDYGIIWYFLGGAAVVGLVFVAATRIGGERRAAQSERVEPLVEFSPDVFNFGTILQQETVNHTFQLVNHGTNTVRIRAMRTSCNCTVIDQDMTGQTIPPEGSVLVPVEFHSRSDEGRGESTVEALLESQGEQYYARATLTGNVNMDFSYLPRGLDFGVLRPGEDAVRTVQFLPGIMKQLELTDLRSSGIFEVSLQTNRAGASNILAVAMPRLQVHFKTPIVKSRQTFSAMIEVHTTSKRVPIVTIFARSTVQPDLEVTPEVLVLPHDDVPGECRLTIRTAGPSKIIRQSIVRDDGLREVRDIGDDAWGLSHVFQVANTSIRGAKKIDFELELQDGTLRNEARSVSVQIKCL